MVGKERWEVIQRLHQAGQSLSAIARELGLDRKTIRSWSRKSEWAPYRRETTGPTLLSEHGAWLV